MEKDEKAIAMIGSLPSFPLGDSKWRYVDEPAFLPSSLLPPKPEQHPFNRFIQRPSERKRSRRKL